jgi:ubiquinone/menaquinone biosynthesis C-methylase UbiE
MDRRDAGRLSRRGSSARAVEDSAPARASPSSLREAAYDAGVSEETTGYLHGYSDHERERLHRQARFLEPWVHDGLPFRRRKRLIEVGSGVGAQTEILLRRFPELHVTGVEINDDQLEEAKRFLATVPWASANGKPRYAIQKADATQLEFESQTFDSAFLCWVLEHVGSPSRVLSEVRRVLVPGSPIVCCEVLNATFFVDPYSPDTLRYWTAFNEHQLEVGGDPFVGAKLGNLLQSVGFRDVETSVKVFHFDNRAPGERAEFLAYWSELLLSGAPQLLAANKVSKDVVDGMTRELAKVARDPNAVFFYASVQANARSW